MSLYPPKRHILIFGPPRSGVTVLSQQTAQSLGLRYLPMGQTAREYRHKLRLHTGQPGDRGRLWKRVAEHFLGRPHGPGSVWNDYPKNPQQADDFVRMLMAHRHQLAMVAVLNVADAATYLQIQQARGDRLQPEQWVADNLWRLLAFKQALPELLTSFAGQPIVLLNAAQPLTDNLALIQQRYHQS